MVFYPAQCAIVVSFSMKARVKLIEGLTFLADGTTGHGITIDGGSERGGRDVGVRPMELILMGLGGCTSIDVMLMLKKQRQQVTDCVIEVEGERADAVPAVFTKIHVKYIVTGKGLSEKQVKRAVDLSSEKYCSVSKMLESSVELSHSFEIVEAE